MKYLYLILLFLSLKSQAQDPLEIIGTDSPLSDVIVKIDLLRVCSHPTNNNPNYFIEKSENSINLRISITHDSIFSCDPLPPHITSYIEINLGRLNSGKYELNILFVDSDESVITGTPFMMYPYHEPYYFQIAHIIPALNIWSLSLLGFLILFFGIIKRNEASFTE